MAKQPNVRGSKRRGSHTTLIDACDPLVKLLNKIPNIGVAPGVIETKARRSSGRSIKVQCKEWGLLIQVTGSLYVQTLQVHTQTNERAQILAEQLEPKLKQSYNRVTIA